MTFVWPPYPTLKNLFEMGLKIDPAVQSRERACKVTARHATINDPGKVHFACALLWSLSLLAHPLYLFPSPFFCLWPHPSSTCRNERMVTLLSMEKHLVTRKCDVV